MAVLLAVFSTRDVNPGSTGSPTVVRHSSTGSPIGFMVYGLWFRELVVYSHNKI